MKHIKLFENFDEFDPFGEEGENILYFNQKFDNFLTKYNWLEHSEILKFRDYGVSLKIKIDRRKWKNKFLFMKNYLDETNYFIELEEQIHRLGNVINHKETGDFFEYLIKK